MTWQDLMKLLGTNLSSLSVSVPMKGEYGETSLSFYEDGSVWTSGNRGSIRIYKNCPYELMFEMYKQKLEETNNDR